MKVNIGPYIKMGEKGERVVDVEIDNYDCWGLDHTLALIILPALKKFNDKGPMGSPYVDNKDVPKKLRPTTEEKEAFDATGNTDDKWHDRWKWILEEMVWSFEQLVEDEDEEYRILSEEGKKAWEKYNKRLNNGLILFGKYFRALWD